MVSSLVISRTNSTCPFSLRAISYTYSPFGSLAVSSSTEPLKRSVISGIQLVSFFPTTLTERSSRNSLIHVALYCSSYVMIPTSPKDRASLASCPRIWEISISRCSLSRSYFNTIQMMTRIFRISRIVMGRI